jgi:hypothetical protein
MRRLRFTLAQLMGVVILIGFGFAALRNANDIWPAQPTVWPSSPSRSLSLAPVPVTNGRAFPGSVSASLAVSVS